MFGRRSRCSAAMTSWGQCYGTVIRCDRKANHHGTHMGHMCGRRWRWEAAPSARSTEP
jgi:hypothetical protein